MADRFTHACKGLRFIEFSDYISYASFKRAISANAFSLFHISFAAAMLVYNHISGENRWISCGRLKTFVRICRVATSQTQFSTCTFSLRFSDNFWRSQGTLEIPVRLTYDFCTLSSLVCCQSNLALFTKAAY